MEEEYEKEQEQGYKYNEDITQEDITAYFEEKRLVRQHLDSFHEFIQNNRRLIEIRPESQHNPTRLR